jgi:hypothetical protein
MNWNVVPAEARNLVSLPKTKHAKPRRTTAPFITPSISGVRLQHCRSAYKQKEQGYQASLQLSTQGLPFGVGYAVFPPFRRNPADGLLQKPGLEPIGYAGIGTVGRPQTPPIHSIHSWMPTDLRQILSSPAQR